MTTRFTARSLALAVALAGLATVASSQTFPSKNIRIVVPYPPGSVVDIVPRLLAERMAADLGQPVVIENKTGGLGIPALTETMNSPADGHLMVAVDAAQWAINPAMQQVPYDFLRDFKAVSMTFTNGLILYTSVQSGITSFEDLVAKAKANPGALNYGSAGIGSVHQLAMETLKNALGIELKHVPFRGSSAMVESLIRNDVQVGFSSVSVVVPQFKAGKARMLAVTIPARIKQIPDVRSIAEITGLKDFNFPGEQGLVVKAATPPAIIDRLNASIRKAAAPAELQAKVLDQTAANLYPTTPEQMTEIIRTDIRKYAAAVKLAGAKAE